MHERAAHLGTINDKLSNQIHFVNEKEYSKYKQGEKESKNDFAGRIRAGSIAYMGSNTAKDMRTIVSESNKADKEVAFTGTISSTREIRLEKLPIDENNLHDKVFISFQLDEKYSNKEQANIFMFGHVHHKGLLNDSYTDAEKAYKLGSPTKFADYTNVLRGGDGKTRQSPALVSTPYGFSLYGTGPSNPYGYRPEGATDVSRVSYGFYKMNKVK